MSAVRLKAFLDSSFYIEQAAALSKVAIMPERKGSSASYWLNYFSEKSPEVPDALKYRRGILRLPD